MASAALPPPSPKTWVINHAKLRRLVAKVERMSEHPKATAEQRKDWARLARNGRRILAKF